MGAKETCAGFRRLYAFPDTCDLFALV